MNGSRTRTKARAQLVLIALAILAMIAGTSWAVVSSNQAKHKAAQEQPAKEESANEPTSSPADGEEEALKYAVDVSDVDRTNRDAVAKRAVEIMTTWYPGTDYNETRAEQRAAGLMSLEKAKSITAPERPATGEDWRRWGELDGYSKPTVKIREPLHGAESDSDDQEVVNVEAIAIWQWAAKGKNSVVSDEQLIYYLAMADSPENGWEVLDYMVESIPY